MIWVLYAIESLAASAVVTAVVWVGVGVAAQPLWLPLVAVGVGAAGRTGRQWAIRALVMGWHQAIKRWIEER